MSNSRPTGFYEIEIVCPGKVLKSAGPLRANYYCFNDNIVNDL